MILAVFCRTTWNNAQAEVLKCRFERLNHRILYDHNLAILSGVSSGSVASLYNCWFMTLLILIMAPLVFRERTARKFQLRLKLTFYVHKCTTVRTPFSCNSLVKNFKQSQRREYLRVLLFHKTRANFAFRLRKMDKPWVRHTPSWVSFADCIGNRRIV